MLHPLSTKWGRRAIVGVVVLAAVSGIVHWGHESATVDGSITVTNSTCENGNVTAVTATVEYSGDAPLTMTPHVWSARQHVQHSWSPTRIVLDPPVARTIRFEPPSPRGYIGGDRAQLYLADGQRRLITNWEVRGCA